MKYALLASSISIALLNHSSFAQEADTDQGLSSSNRMEVIRIIGTSEDARRIAGSGSVIDEQQIRVEAATDINQLLKTVPGTYVREEEGVGLRPNIGIRAAGSERSSKVTLMEDGILVAPAPYSNPAAYYFPTAMRMTSVEVLKGAPLLRHGPQTTGGVINLISTPIPEVNAGAITATVGENSSRDLHAHYGGRSDQFGWLVETVQRDSDGFKQIDRTNRDAGYDIQDYLVKLGWEGASHSLLFKAQYSEETSNESYLGLTDAHFDRNANRRYGLSAIDQMNNQHEGYSLTYKRDIGERTLVTAVGYYNEFARDWFKLGGGSAFIDAANTGDSNAQAVLEGTMDVAGLNYKHNNRTYSSSGLELNTRIDLNAHQLEFGGRIHRDEMDRFQPVEVYDQINGSLVFQNIISPTGSDNRLETGKGLSFWAIDDWQLNDALQLNLALRHERVESSRKQFDGTSRQTPPNRRENTSDLWLPGASFTYNLNDSWQVLAGVHRGFSPLGGGAVSSEEPETSVNYEAGLRFGRDNLFVEAIGFLSNFDNKAENCSLANPCSDGSTSGNFITGEAQVAGLELQINHQFELSSLHMPLNLSYTYTQAEIRQDNPTNGFIEGDRLADIPENTLSLNIGLETNFGWNNYVVAKYTDSMCDKVGCNRDPAPLTETDSFHVVDLISRYEFSPRTEVFLKVENLLNERAIVSRKPDGARPNKPQTATIGLQHRF